MAYFHQVNILVTAYFRKWFCCYQRAPADGLSFVQQREDLKAVVNYLRTDGNVSCIGLWGRSMGAVTR